MGQKSIIVVIVVLILGSLIWYFSGTRQFPTNLNNVFEIEDQNIPAFLEFVGERGWYSHEIISVDGDTKTLVVRDGIGHEFILSFDFADTHLREHHRNVTSYIEELGLNGFLVFAMENNLYQHKIGPVDSENQAVLIYGDKGTEFETEFYMTFDNIINHMQRDHKWTNKELLDAGYCESAFKRMDVDICTQKLIYRN